MKFFKVIFILLFLSFFNSYAQHFDAVQLVNQNAEPYEGFKSFRTSFLEKIDVSKFNSVQDTVKAKLTFVVERDGSFLDVNVVTQLPEVAEEIKKVFITMPKWKPAVYEGKHVRSSFTLPIVIVVDNENKSKNFLKDIATYRKLLKSQEQSTDNFEFKCNCITIAATIDSDNSFEIFQYETLDKIGLYTISIKKYTEKQKKKFFKNLISQISETGIEYKKVKFEETDALDVKMTEIWEEKEIYIRVIFFFDNTSLYKLSFASENPNITNFIFEELIESFQIKKQQ